MDIGTLIEVLRNGWMFYGIGKEILGYIRRKTKRPEPPSKPEPEPQKQQKTKKRKGKRKGKKR